MFIDAVNSNSVNINNVLLNEKISSWLWVYDAFPVEWSEHQDDGALAAADAQREL